MHIHGRLCTINKSIKRTAPDNICILKTISNPISYVSKNSRFFNLEILNETLSFTAPRFLLKQWSMVSLPLDVCGDALTKDERYTDPMQQFPSLCQSSALFTVPSYLNKRCSSLHSTGHSAQVHIISKVRQPREPQPLPIRSVILPQWNQYRTKCLP